MMDQVCLKVAIEKGEQVFDERWCLPQFLSSFFVFLFKHKVEGSRSHLDDKTFNTAVCGESGECACDMDCLGRRLMVQSTASHPGQCVCP